MKKLLSLVSLVILAVACDNEENSPAPIAPDLVPLKMEELDGSRELIYNASGKIGGLAIVTRYANGSEMTSIQTLLYDTNGRLTESTTDTGYRMVYTYNDDGLITKTQEYVNGTWWQVHVYDYYDEGLLKQSITYQDIPEEGGVIPVAKDEYVYDTKGNVIIHRLYYYTSFGAEAKLLTMFTYGGYDDKINTEEYFDIHPFNPLVKIRKNNPGKMVVQNANGVTSIVETYQYEYNVQGFATQKTSFVTMYNGNTGSHTTKYTFKN
jgi:YD repeat-containing protein